LTASCSEDIWQTLTLAIHCANEKLSSSTGALMITVPGVAFPHPLICSPLS